MSLGNEAQVSNATQRIKLTIRCNQCGERYTLRAQPGPNIRLNSGFKMCICGNTNDIEIEFLD